MIFGLQVEAATLLADNLVVTHSFTRPQLYMPKKIRFLDTKPCRIIWKLYQKVILEPKRCNLNKKSEFCNFLYSETTFSHNFHMILHGFVWRNKKRIALCKNVDVYLFLFFNAFETCLQFLYFWVSTQCFLSFSTQNHAESYGNYFKNFMLGPETYDIR